jgi:hypothetical protein
MTAQVDISEQAIERLLAPPDHHEREATREELEALIRALRSALTAIAKPVAAGVPEDFEFTKEELREILTSPAAFDIAADYNDEQESLSDSQGMNSCAEHHKARRYVLKQIEQKILEERDRG